MIFAILRLIISGIFVFAAIKWRKSLSYTKYQIFLFLWWLVDSVRDLLKSLNVISLDTSTILGYITLVIILLGLVCWIIENFTQKAKVK